MRESCLSLDAGFGDSQFPLADELNAPRDCRSRKACCPGEMCGGSAAFRATFVLYMPPLKGCSVEQPWVLFVI